MFKSFAFFIIYGLTLLPNLAQATPESQALRDVMQAQVDIKTTCTLTVSSGNGEVLLKIPRNWSGNGYFVKHSLKNLVKTAGHVVDCNPSEQALKNIRQMFGSVQALSVNFSASISVVYKNKEYPANVLKYSFGEGAPDYAVLLTVNMPNSVLHHDLPVIFGDGIFGVGDEAVVSGKLPFGEQGKENEWYLKKVLIAKLDNQSIRFSEAIYKGLSGSPLLFYYEGKYYAIGTIVSGWFTETADGNSISLDASIAVRLQKDFFDIRTKTAPN